MVALLSIGPEDPLWEVSSWDPLSTSENTWIMSRSATTIYLLNITWYLHQNTHFGSIHLHAESFRGTLRRPIQTWLTFNKNPFRPEISTMFPAAKSTWFLWQYSLASELESRLPILWWTPPSKEHWRAGGRGWAQSGCSPWLLLSTKMCTFESRASCPSAFTPTKYLHCPTETHPATPSWPV